MNQALRGKVALVAGATRGEGRGITTELGSRPGVCTACVTNFDFQSFPEKY